MFGEKTRVSAVTMTKEEAAAEEVKTDTKTETTTDTPAKEGASAEASTTKPAEGEAAGTSEGGEGGGEGAEAPKESSGEKRDADFKSSKKRRWFWHKKDDMRSGEAATGSAEGQNGGTEDKEAAAEREMSEAEMEAEIQRRAKELEIEKERLKQRIDIYKKHDALEMDVSDMKLELEDIMNKYKNKQCKADSEGSGAAKPSAQ